MPRRKKNRPSRRRRGSKPSPDGAHDEKGVTPPARRRALPPPGGDLWSLLDATSLRTFLASVALLCLGVALAVWTDNDWFLLLGVPTVLQMTAGKVGIARSNKANMRRAWERRRRR